MRQSPIPDQEAQEASESFPQVRHDIVESAFDPNRPWQLIVRDASGTEYRRIGFRTYGDAWHAAEHQNFEKDHCQANLLAVAQHQPDIGPNDYQTDVMTWSGRQAGLLRRVAAGEKVIDQVDWDNVVDEIEAVGRRQLAQVKSLLVEALAGFLKVAGWPRSPDVPGWRTDAVGLQRDAYAILTPAMRRRIDVNEFYFKALRRLPKMIDGQEPLPFPTECPVRLEDLLGD